ncbi:MAG: 30S ribosomal protein S12 methylthiotransferase RimO [Prevotellaceae bacterium]|jgi:ribosomal protein S12 methylthiotransferase|nr:30S ribosomal protein S12 methylthiotransferase RimO [Prevotellaceae bacterium]
MTYNPRLIKIITLGCAKNLVDSERLMQQLQAAGFHVRHSDHAAGAKTVLINTCGFINDAKEESVNTILSVIAAKKRGGVERIFVFGCLSQRYRHELQQELPEVDRFFGVEEFDKIVETLGGVPSPKYLTRRAIATPPHYAYLKISEGCNWGCAYCAIPLIRGKHRSTPVEQLVVETKLLAARGVKELLITAQDTTYYGIDLYGYRRLPGLLTALSEVKGIEWIRLHYAYPAQFPEDVLPVMRDNPKLCKYLDIPLQHISGKVLKNMRRGINSRQTRALVEKLRAEIPGIALRTTLIVGHPGEDDAAFRELEDFVEETRFERLGVFCYSEEEGTYGAQHFTDTIPDREKQARRDRIMSLQARISQQLNEEKIGKTFRTLIDRQEDGYCAGRTQYDTPEVDGEVLVSTANNALQPGKFYDVLITAAETYDLFGSYSAP